MHLHCVCIAARQDFITVFYFHFSLLPLLVLLIYVSYLLGIAFHKHGIWSSRFATFDKKKAKNTAISMVSFFVFLL